MGDVSIPLIQSPLQGAVDPHSPVIALQWMLKHAQDDDRGAM